MKDRDVVIDIDTIKISGDPEVSDDNSGNTFSFTLCNMPMSTDELAKDENSVSLSSNEKINVSKSAKKEKRLSMSAKKPPKPPRPPRGLSLDAADQKLIKEISELAMIKRARIERMKALKKMKAAKASSASTSSSGNLIAMLFTILFCIVILFQGCHPSEIFPSNSPAIGIVSSPTSNGATEGKIVGVVDQQNSPTSSVHAFSGAGSPSLMEMVPGSDNKDEGTKSIH
ncbi:hypothetical protein DH2020_020114 [Rehmannia glutinosa]|uniref:Transmembrane protein n=1 Tax=Rehmannia glutinosa TaxID=99300 RepID=A0ABR0WJB3_REHGL